MIVLSSYALCTFLQSLPPFVIIYIYIVKVCKSKTRVDRTLISGRRSKVGARNRIEIVENYGIGSGIYVVLFRYIL